MKKLVVIGVSALSFGAISLMVWYYSKTIRYRKNRVYIEIPNKFIGQLVGRNGSTVKNIQNQAKVTIKFVESEASADSSRCVIKGYPASVQLAVDIIENIIKNSSNADEPTLESPRDDASQLVDNVQSKIKTDDVDEMPDIDLFFHPNNGNTLSFGQNDSVLDFIEKHTQKLSSPGGDGLIPVYVSAVSHPEKFYVQAIKTKEHADLDRLTMEMSEYYQSNSSSNSLPPFSDIKPGYLCAVFFRNDNRWYRAVIRDTSESSGITPDSRLLLYLLDYGEYVFEQIENIRPIPAEFLKLSFQAIECGLSKVKAVHGSWSQDSILLFEDMVHVGQWYTLKARVDHDESRFRPYIALFDTNGETCVNIAEKLVEAGVAVALD